MSALKLNDGRDIPIFAFGTRTKRHADDVNAYAALKHAFKIGIRHVDTAYYYCNEQLVGHAINDSIKEGTISREDIFITTKCWPNFFTRDRVVEACKRSLFMLQTDYVDLYLLHLPLAFEQGEKLVPRDDRGNPIEADIDFCSEAWKGMEDCRNLGLTKSIGVSNFNSRQISALLKACASKPVVNQIESHPLLAQTKLIGFCRSNDIVVEAYSPLGGGNPAMTGVKEKLFVHPLLIELSKKYGKTIPQILLKFHTQRGVVAVTKSFNADHISSNFDIFDFEMTQGEVEALEGLNENHRRNRFTEYTSFKNYPFHDEF